MDLELLEALRRFRSGKRRAAVATVVNVQGSAYRREGARMLLAEDGEMVGSVSGGCLESDLLEHSRNLGREERGRLLFYDLTADDDLVWGLGLGCNGKVTVYLEPLTDDLSRDLERVMSEESPQVLATVVEPRESGLTRGARIRIRPDGGVEGSLGDPAVDRAATEAGLARLKDGRSKTESLETEGRPDIFFEVFQPPTHLCIFGAGHDALPLARFAHETGFRVTVVDSRPQFAVQERFPWADDVVLSEPEGIREKVHFSPSTYAVVMTHNFLQDVRILAELLQSDAPYIGLLGPRQRAERLLKQIEDRTGAPVDPAEMERLFAPIGLNLGADSPEEIAIAVVAEILARRNGRPAGFLKGHAGAIHA